MDAVGTTGTLLAPEAPEESTASGIDDAADFLEEP
jgi:hypothetical protein